MKLNTCYLQLPPKMTIEPATSASSIPQRSDDRLEDSIKDQIPNADVVITVTGSGGQAHLAAPAVFPEGNPEAGPGAAGIPPSESIRQAQSLQEARHVPRVVDESHERPDGTSDEANSHQERDLERAGPTLPSSSVSSGAFSRIRQWLKTPERREYVTAGYARLKRLYRLMRSGKSLAEQNQSLINCLRSRAGVNGEETYRRYAMGFGRRKRYRRLVEATLNKIATASSNQRNGWFVEGSAILSQHLISRWAHSGFRKYFQTTFCNTTAVYLLQNLGDSSDRWLDDTLRSDLGLSPRFLDEHLALVYDGSRAGPTDDDDTQTQLVSGIWHICAVLSDQQILQFQSLTAPSPPQRRSNDVYLIAADRIGFL